MGNSRKMGRLAAESFKNGLRLHRDSIALFDRHSYPSSYQLSILAQEEIGKTFVFEEVAFQYRASDMTEEDAARFLKATLLDHRVKQSWFVRHAGEWTGRGGLGSLSAFATEVYEGKLERRKQNAVYVGLPVRNKTIDLKGRINRPRKIKRQQAEQHITGVNDFVIEIIERCRRDLSIVDTSELDEALDHSLVAELEALWSSSSSASRRRLKRIRNWPLADEEP